MLLRTLAPAVGLALAFAVPAEAARTWLPPVAPFGDVAALDRDADASMAPDGTIVTARRAPNGGVEVRERPPGGPFGPTVTLPPVSAVPVELPNLEVLTGPDGTAAVLYDLGNIRYASIRPPGGRWPAPAELSLSEAGPGAAGIGPDGVVSIVARDAADGHRLRLYRLAAGGTVRSQPLPAPPAGAEQIRGVIAVPKAGHARVVFLQRLMTVEGGRCTTTSSIHAVEVDAVSGASTLLDRYVATGPFLQGVCNPEQGTVLGPMLRTATGVDGDTVVHVVFDLASLRVFTRARHREPGGNWPDPAAPPERVGTGDEIPGVLLAGAGDPVLVVSGNGGEVQVSRRAGGRWTAPVTISSIFGAPAVEAARTGAGTTVFAWLDRGSSTVFTRLLGADGTLGAPVTLRDRGTAVLGVGGDAEGNAAVLFSEPFGNAARLLLSGFDAAGPRLALTAPNEGIAGQSLAFAVSGQDVWSGPLRTATWDFGDGATAAGLSITHAFAAAGARTVRARGEDAVGNATTAAREVTIGPAPTPTPTPTPTPSPAPMPTSTPTPTPTPTPADTRPPVLAPLAVSPKPPLAGRPATLRLLTDEGGQLLVTLGRSTGKPQRLTILRPVGAGLHRIPLPRLDAGRWRITATVTDAAGNPSLPRQLTVRVLRRPSGVSGTVCRAPGFALATTTDGSFVRGGREWESYAPC